MTKKEKLEKLDELVLDNMISFMRDKDFENIKNLTNAVSYLKINQVVESKNKDLDPTKERIKKLKEIEAERRKNVDI